MEIVRPASLFFVTFWKIQGDGGVYTKFCSRILPFDHNSIQSDLKEISTLNTLENTAVAFLNYHLYSI